jgi:hypothetical protein
VGDGQDSRNDLDHFPKSQLRIISGERNRTLCQGDPPLLSVPHPHPLSCSTDHGRSIRAVSLFSSRFTHSLISALLVSISLSAREEQEGCCKGSEHHARIPFLWSLEVPSLPSHFLTLLPLLLRYDYNFSYFYPGFLPRPFHSCCLSHSLSLPPYLLLPTRDLSP